MSRPAWSVHLPTADATCVRLRLRPRGPTDPWPFSLALTRLAALGAVGEERFRSLGAGRGEPLLASQELRWHGCPLHLETTLERDGRREVSLSLPAWDELATGDAVEDDLWELVDALAAAVDAERGALGDGEALDDGLPQRALARHLALLVPEGDAQAWPLGGAARYRDLPLSGLAVLLR